MQAPEAGEGYTTSTKQVTTFNARQHEPPKDCWNVLDLFCGCGGLNVTEIVKLVSFHNVFSLQNTAYSQGPPVNPIASRLMCGN